MKKRNSLAIFLAVQKALFLREFNMRISVGKIGLFWTFFEPFAQVSVFILIRVVIRGKDSGTMGYDYAVFLAVGFIAFNMFRKILNSSMGAFIANKGLFTYRQVKPIDTIIARILLEVFIMLIIICMFLFIAFLLNYELKPDNFPFLVASYLWLIVFSFGIGLIVSIGNTFYVSIGKFVHIISFLLLFFSAVFYSLVSIPPEIREILLYNPLVHFMEMIHANYIYELDDRFVDYSYILRWTVGSLFIGLWLYVKLERRIISE